MILVKTVMIYGQGFLSSINVINQWDIASDLRFFIVKALFERGIE